MRGDIILYRSSGRWYERAIVFATKGPMVHVAIQLSDVQVIAAGSKGIALFPYSAQDKQCTTVSLASRTTPEGIERGLQWAIAQEGKSYGWLDVVYQGIKFLFPNNKLQLSEDGHYDCSDFSVRYLQQAGVQLPPDYEDSYTVTPNDLARLFLDGGMKNV
jgi:uncharacterized protein YycO